MEPYKKGIPVDDDPAALGVPTASTNSRRYPERSNYSPRTRRPWGTMDMPLNLTKKGYKQWFRARLGAVTRRRKKRADEMTVDEVQNVLEQLLVLRRTTEWCCEELYAQKWREMSDQQSYNEGLRDVHALDRWFKFRLGQAEQELEDKFYALAGVGWRSRALPPSPLIEQHGGHVGWGEKVGDGGHVGDGAKVGDSFPHVFNAQQQRVPVGCSPRSTVPDVSFPSFTVSSDRESLTASQNSSIMLDPPPARFNPQAAGFTMTRHQRPPAEYSPSSTALNASPTSLTVLSDSESLAASPNSSTTLDPPPARLNPQATGFAMTRSTSAGSWSDDDIFIPNIRTFPATLEAEFLRELTETDGQEKEGRKGCVSRPTSI